LAVNLPTWKRTFPRNLPFLKRSQRLSITSNITVLVGENGSGKSTLLEAIALKAELPTAGAYDVLNDPTLEGVQPLADATTLEWDIRRRQGVYLRTEDYFGYALRLRREQRELLAQAAEIDADVAASPEERARRSGPLKVSAHALTARYGGDLDHRSHGESFLAFFAARLRSPGLHLLDEPEAALSPLRQLALAELMLRESERGAQFIVATHAPILMALPGATCVYISDAGLVPMAFDELPPVALLRSFIEHPSAFWQHLGQSQER